MNEIEFPEDGSFETMLSQLPQASDNTKRLWVEDEIRPYSLYDAYREAVRAARMNFLRRIAPRV